MSDFNPGDKVIKKGEKDAANAGTVMDIPAIQRKPGYVAVYFKRHVWIKPENLMHFEEWQAQRKKDESWGRESIVNYWNKSPSVQNRLLKKVQS